ncbi:MAG: hypothetical protein KME13_00720 [Myxacorys californica WJT36-NPBG1]|jgi:hypothetical protein|nr:hypothetical protein [Myxacorys californica WJT36-NPBG1]
MLSLSLVLAMTVSLWGCGGSAPAAIPPEAISVGRTGVSKLKPAPTKISGKISEVSPPEVIGQLKDVLDQYQPQLTIASPRSDEVLNDNTVSIKFQVQDLPVFKDEKLGLGPHIHLFLDDQPYQAVYDISKPVVLKDLAAGTHTVRAFASRPWHESFKNEGAYAQTTFHVFTKTPDNNPSADQPLLTYSRPQGSYGAEPIMLDFYLTNAPLHFVAQEDKKDEIADWRIKATVNGSSFILDRWQPIYLKGFEPGKNWVQLEYIDENGNAIQNVYNNTARIFTYESGGNDALSKLVRGDLSFDAARSIVDPNYKPSEPKTPEVPTLKPAPSLEVTPAPDIAPVVPLPQVNNKSPLVPVVPLPEATEKLPAEPENVPEKETPLAPAPESQSSKKPKGGFFNRFRSGTEKSDSKATPAPSEAPKLINPEEPSKPSETTENKTPEIPKVIKAKELEPKKVEVKEPEAVPAVEVPEVKEPAPVVPPIKETPKGGFFNRFRPGAKSSPAPALPEPPAEAIKKAVEPEAKPSDSKDSVVERYDDKFKELEDAPAKLSKPAAKPEASEALKAIDKAVPKPSATKAPVKAPISVPAPTNPSPVEDLEATETTLPELAAPPAPEPTPKAGFFNRFRPTKAPKATPTPSFEVPKATPSPTPNPQDPLQILEKKETADNKPNEPSANEGARDSLVDRLLKSPEPTKPDPTIAKPADTTNKSSENVSSEVSPTLSSPKPTASSGPSIRPTAKTPAPVEPSSKDISTPAVPKVETPVASPTEVEAPDTSGFQPQTELERRLGIPLKALSPTP